jgi:hypothetical protein
LADYCGLLSNLSMKGDTRFEGTQPPWPNCLKLRLSGYTCELVQGSEYLRSPTSEEKRSFFYTTDAIVRNVSSERVPAAKRLVTDLAALLSFATLSPVWHFGWNYPMGTGNSGRTLAPRGLWQYFRPTLNTLHAPTLRTFVENAWLPYRRLKKVFRLDAIFDYLVQAEASHQVIEVQLALAFLVLECLKHGYANHAGIPQVDGFFRHIEAHKPNPKKWRKYSFECLLKEMFSSQGMNKRSLKRVVAARNQLIHEGLLRRAPKARVELYARVQDLIREYLLRLLCYRGRYSTYSMSRAIL